MTHGYSDHINHALAFAAKYHDQQVRKGTRLPYLTRPANVALILTRYGQDDQTVIAGILHDVVEHAGRTQHAGADALERVEEKFGAELVATLQGVSERRLDDDGVELSTDDRRDDYLERLGAASDAGRWLAAAANLHEAGGLLADLRRTEFPESVWNRFAAGREGTVSWYRRIHDRLRTLGFSAPIMDELLLLVEELEQWREPALRVSTR
jgi:predicted HD phosphohydrolase